MASIESPQSMHQEVTPFRENFGTWKPYLSALYELRIVPYLYYFPDKDDPNQIIRLQYIMASLSFDSFPKPNTLFFELKGSHPFFYFSNQTNKQHLIYYVDTPNSIFSKKKDEFRIRRNSGNCAQPTPNPEGFFFPIALKSTLALKPDTRLLLPFQTMISAPLMEMNPPGRFRK